jgi:hypothetical protein
LVNAVGGVLLSLKEIPMLWTQFLRSFTLCQSFFMLLTVWIMMKLLAFSKEVNKVYTVLLE